MTPPAVRQLSLRDPSGKLVDWNGRLLRTVEPAVESTLRNVESNAALKAKIDSGHLISFRRLSASEIPWENAGLVLEHPRVWFPTYPTEWPAEMLARAAELTLDLAEDGLPSGLGLKDATPWNVLFRATEPVFVDLLSFEDRHPEDGTWLAAAQFQRTFLYPLLADRELALPADEVFTRHRDGWQAETIYRMLGWSQRLRPPFFGLITLPTWLSGKAAQTPSLYEPRPTGDPEKAQFLLKSWYRHMRRALRRVSPRPNRASAWSNYETKADAAQADAKERFLGRVLDSTKPKSLLDLGCNTGRFASFSARRKVDTVAADRDPAVVGRLWSRAREERLPLWPLVLDLARPSPAMGWNNRETLSFTERATGRFEVILAYAILHHLWVGEGISMEETLGWLHSLGAAHLVAEHVAPEDVRVEQLRRGRTLPDLSVAAFEAAARACGFKTLSKEPLPGGTRTLFHFQRG